MCDYKGQPLSCCVHGSPVFMHWHRLYVEQVENVLLAHGSAVAMPYWDWTTPIAKLPAFFHDASYINSRTQKEEPNPFFRSGRGWGVWVCGGGGGEGEGLVRALVSKGGGLGVWGAFVVVVGVCVCVCVCVCECVHLCVCV